jgi:hypothetical protein
MNYSNVCLGKTQWTRKTLIMLGNVNKCWKVLGGVKKFRQQAKSTQQHAENAW